MHAAQLIKKEEEGKKTEIHAQLSTKMR